MASSTVELRGMLANARAQGTLVRIVSSVEPGWTEGFVVDVGREFVLLCLIADLIVYNGFQVVRLMDLSDVQSPAPHAEFVERALALRAEHRPVDPAVDLSSIERLLRSACATFDVVTIHREVVDPGACYIGAVEAISEGNATLRVLDPDAQWDEEREIVRLADVTRVDFGGLYEVALLAVSEAG
jgi:hypothetical protein